MTSKPCSIPAFFSTLSTHHRGVVILPAERSPSLRPPRPSTLVVSVDRGHLGIIPPPQCDGLSVG